LRFLAVAFSRHDRLVGGDGEEIAADTEKGYTAVTVEGVTCGFGKVSGGTLKNRYPKGLRTF